MFIGTFGGLAPRGFDYAVEGSWGSESYVLELRSETRGGGGRNTGLGFIGFRV